MGFFRKKNKNNIKPDIYPQKIRKSIYFDGRVRKGKVYDYELVKVYPNFALYKNKVFENIKETLTKRDLRKNDFIEIISEGNFFESEYYDIWE